MLIDVNKQWSTPYVGRLKIALNLIQFIKKITSHKLATHSREISNVTKQKLDLALNGPAKHMSTRRRKIGIYC